MSCVAVMQLGACLGRASKTVQIFFCLTPLRKLCFNWCRPSQHSQRKGTHALKNFRFQRTIPGSLLLQPVQAAVVARPRYGQPPRMVSKMPVNCEHRFHADSSLDRGHDRLAIPTLFPDPPQLSPLRLNHGASSTKTMIDGFPTGA